MNDNLKTGTLLNSNNIKIHRQYFREMVRLQGIYVLYRSPKDSKHYTQFGELDSDYNEPKLVGCVFDEHPTQQTLKKMGWMSELDSNSSIIHVDYDLEGLQQGALFIIPSGLDDGKGRIFRVVKLTNIMVYPASIACEIVPEYINTFVEDTGYDEASGKIDILNPEVGNPTHPLEERFLELDGE